MITFLQRMKYTWSRFTRMWMIIMDKDDAREVWSENEKPASLIFVHAFTYNQASDMCMISCLLHTTVLIFHTLVVFVPTNIQFYCKIKKCFHIKWLLKNWFVSCHLKTVMSRGSLFNVVQNRIKVTRTKWDKEVHFTPDLFSAWLL